MVSAKAWMKLAIQRIGLVSFIITAAALVVLWGCGGFPPHEKQTGRLLDDKVTARRVQAALTNNLSYNFPRVRVAATNGTVTLSGYVENDAQRQEAAALAQSVDQVRKVQNGLQLQSLSPTGAAHGF